MISPRLAIGAMLLAELTTNPQPFYVRPYGPESWAVSRTFGTAMVWSFKPGERFEQLDTQDLCIGVPSQEYAEFIARALNNRKGH